MPLGERELFGEIAWNKGFVSKEDVEKALEIQKEIDRSGGKHKLIGIILLEMGALSSQQLLEILQQLDTQTRKSSRRRRVQL